MSAMRGELRLIWADKIIIFLAIALLAVTSLSWALVAIAAGIPGANHVITSFGSGMAADAGFGLAALWLVLRGLDLAAGGSTAKLFGAAPRKGTAMADRGLPVGPQIAA